MLGLLTYLGLLAALVMGALRRPAVGLAGVLCLYGLKQWGQTTTTFFAEYRQTTNIVVGVVVLVGVIRLAAKRSCVFCQLPTVALLIFALYLYALTSTIWAVDSGSSLDEWANQGPYIITIAILAPLLVGDLADIRDAFRWTVCVGGAICFLVLIFGTWGFRGLALYSGADATETNPLALATLGGTVMLASSMFILESRPALLRVIAAACIPIALAIVWRSGSRGQLIAILPSFVVASAIGFRLNNVRSVAALILMTSLVVALGWWASTLIDFNASRWTGTDQATEDVQGRIDMAQTLLHAAFAHPATMLFGIGNSSSFDVVGIYPHITILEVIAEEGIPGTILYLAILVLAVRSIRRILGTLGEDRVARRTVAMLAALFCFELILSWKQGSLLSSAYVFGYAIILGRIELLLAGRTTVEDHSSPTSPPLVLFPNLMR